MCQLAAGSFVLLVDLFVLKQQPVLHAQTVSWLASLMMNPQVNKVFFDCHKDSEALHKGLGCCVANVFDVQAVHMLIKQWKAGEQVENWVATPGLNKVLEEYKASHGINIYKEKMKEIFAEETETYETRPLSLMSLRYAASDVEDLVEVKGKMLAELSQLFKSGKGPLVAETLSREYAEQGCKAVAPKAA